MLLKCVDEDLTIKQLEKIETRKNLWERNKNFFLIEEKDIEKKDEKTSKKNWDKNKITTK